MAEFDIIATAAFGMEAIVVRELKDLGYEHAVVEDGRIRFRGDHLAICRANLWLRCAERVQVVVADFKARDFDELFDQVKAISWEDWLPIDAKFPVTARCVRADIRSVPNTQKMVKRAIVDRLRQVYQRHWFAESGIEYNIDASILGERVVITLDTTGDGLHKRGYRNLVGQAPLRETVAAGMVKLSYWRRDRLLVDPFCGSGTIPIEAAMIARNLAPGRNRSFACENWVQIPRSVWAAARQEVRDLEIRQPLSIPIVATDRERYAIKMATQHARQAGVETDIHFDVREFYAFPTNRDAGILICNPPYGERLGDEKEVRQLYADMGELLIPLDDWSLYILTGAEGFERYFGKQADRRRKLYNARIACTLYQYLGPKPAGLGQTEDAPASDASPETQAAPVEEAEDGVHSAPAVETRSGDQYEEHRFVPPPNPWLKAKRVPSTPTSAAEAPATAQTEIPPAPQRPAARSDSPSERVAADSTEDEGRSTIREELRPVGETTETPIAEVPAAVSPWQTRPVVPSIPESAGETSSPRVEDPVPGASDKSGPAEPVSEPASVAPAQREAAADPAPAVQRPAVNPWLARQNAPAKPAEPASPSASTVPEEPPATPVAPTPAEQEKSPPAPDSGSTEKKASPASGAHPWKKNPWQKR